MSEQTDFEKFRPIITEITTVKVASEFGLGNDILSLDGKEAPLDTFIVQFATDEEILGPYLLNTFCARELCARLLAAGFGP